MPERTLRDTRYVRLVLEDTYRSGEPYRDWELQLDAPDVPAKEASADPPYAARGDILREESDDDLTPFKLRRNHRTIGSPEWWQVRHLFEAPAADVVPTLLESLRTGTLNDGVKFEQWRTLVPVSLDQRGEWPAGSRFLRMASKPSGRRYSIHAKGHSGESYDEFLPDYLGQDMLRLNELIQDVDGHRTAIRCLAPNFSSLRLVNAVVARVQVDMERGGIRAGDLLFHAPPKLWPAVHRATVRPLGLDDYEALRADRLAVSNDSDDPFEHVSPWFEYSSLSVYTFLRNRVKWGRTAKKFTPKLAHVRPIESRVSCPIVATNDAHAAFELFGQVERQQLREHT